MCKKGHRQKARSNGGGTFKIPIKQADLFMQRAGLSFTLRTKKQYIVCLFYQLDLKTLT